MEHRSTGRRMHWPAGSGQPRISDLANLAGPLEVVQAYLNYRQTVEIETTKRRQIESQCRLAIERLLAEKELLLSYCDQVFAERRVSLEHFYRLLADAVRFGSDHQLDTALTGILTIIRTSPFQSYGEFCETMRRADRQIEL